MTDYSRWILGTSACLTLWWFGFTPQWLVLKIWRSIAAVLGIFLGPVVALLRGSPDEEELLTLKASMRWPLCASWAVSVSWEAHLRPAGRRCSVGQGPANV